MGVKAEVPVSSLRVFTAWPNLESQGPSLRCGHHRAPLRAKAFPVFKQAGCVCVCVCWIVSQYKPIARHLLGKLCTQAKIDMTKSTCVLFGMADGLAAHVDSMSVSSAN